MRGTHTLKPRTLKVSAVLAGAVIAVAVGCVPPPPGGGGGGPTPAPPPPGGGGPGPGGETFLAGKPPPGQNYNGSASRVQISADGNWVVYHHGSENLVVANKPPAGCPSTKFGLPASSGSPVGNSAFRCS